MRKYTRAHVYGHACKQVSMTQVEKTASTEKATWAVFLNLPRSPLFASLFLCFYQASSLPSFFTLLHPSSCFLLHRTLDERYTHDSLAFASGHSSINAWMPFPTKPVPPVTNTTRFLERSGRGAAFGCSWLRLVVGWLVGWLVGRWCCCYLHVHM